MQTWPAFTILPHRRRRAARRMSAFLVTIAGLRPPSSRVIGVRVSAAFFAIIVPTVAPPV